MKKDRRRAWWILFLLLAIALGILAIYYYSIEKIPEKTPIQVSEKKPSPKTEEVLQTVMEIPPKSEETNQIIESSEKTFHTQEDPCKLSEDQLSEFFDYLNTRNYIQSTEEGLNTYDRFKEWIKKLSAQPPTPSGEGLDKDIMFRNVFHFFRVLDPKDIRLIKRIMNNEADTMEMNLEMLYTWLMLGDRCPDDEGIRPPFDLTYLYAGYLLNTLGGRAYLLRRSSEMRLLGRYYCALIIHEADKKGKNHYGIDISPEIDSLLKDISRYPDFRFQGNYIDQLTKIQEYYSRKR